MKEPWLSQEMTLWLLRDPPIFLDGVGIEKFELGEHQPTDQADPAMLGVCTLWAWMPFGEPLLENINGLTIELHHKIWGRRERYFVDEAVARLANIQVKRQWLMDERKEDAIVLYTAFECVVQWVKQK